MDEFNSCKLNKTSDVNAIQTSQIPIEQHHQCRLRSTKYRVLLMDDDPIIRFVVEKLLLKAGFEVVCVDCSEDAISLYKTENTANPFSIVIMDLTIPGGIGGKESVKILKEFDSKAKVIAFSGYSHDPIIFDFAEYGFDGVLCKPFTNKEIIDLVTSLLGNIGRD
jgi:DNA-binding response OmpR family regulator